jgi:predicted SprT family Zn-dependent metalloprotease
MRLPDARKLALELMAEHGLTQTGRAPEFGVRVWRFTFDNAVRRFGVCRYHKGTISLSRVLVKLNPDAEVRNTILHEIAHALAGHANGHNHVWKRIAERIGARPERCYSRRQVTTPDPKFVGHCRTQGCRGYYTNRRSDTWCPRCAKLTLGYVRGSTRDAARYWTNLTPEEKDQLSIVWRRYQKAMAA